ncbi:MAG: septal ring lytic transglycosylase RlpA family protein [Candidatus Margulisiibacteriota bacterium]
MTSTSQITGYIATLSNAARYLQKARPFLSLSNPTRLAIIGAMQCIGNAVDISAITQALITADKVVQLVKELKQSIPPVFCTGKATHYSAARGSETASGEGYNPDILAAAYNGTPGRELPCGSIVRVTNLANGKSVEVKINDHGPWIIRSSREKIPYPEGGRRIDLTPAAFSKIADLGTGVLNVRIEVVQLGSGRQF